MQNSGHGGTNVRARIGRILILTPVRQKLSQMQLSRLFPLLLIACNAGAALAYLWAGDWKRAIYWAASSVCVLAVTL